MEKFSNGPRTSIRSVSKLTGDNTKRFLYVAVLVYLVDFIIFGKTFEDHLDTLKNATYSVSAEGFSVKIKRILNFTLCWLKKA